jgi:MoaA/NifB/PqqE/SkfB family radical SAM enzyme
MIPDIYELTAKTSDFAELVRYYEQLVPVVYPATFPENFRLAPADWYLPSAVSQRDLVTYKGKSIRPIGTLDVEFLSDEILDLAQRGLVNLANNYPCGMKCPGCFSEDVTYQDASKFLRWSQMFDVIDDARTIGLKSIKFLGPGELFQNPDLFKILDAAEERRLPISIFTKGSELGDDHLAQHVFGRLGIGSASELASRIAKYSCVRILLGFNSFDPVKQDKIVGSHRASGHYEFVGGTFLNRGVEKYTHKRNTALVNLINARFNSPEKGQRLSLIAAPLKLDQFMEVPDMYVWAARRNMPLVIAPSMESGPRARGLMRSDTKRDPQHEILKKIFVGVYERAIDEGIVDLKTLQEEGISAYMGTAPCNQVAHGMYVRINGQVQMCPGSLNSEHVFGNAHERSIVEIWRDSPNYTLGKLQNNWCRAKQQGMPHWLQTDVMSHLMDRSQVESTKIHQAAVVI